MTEAFQPATTIEKEEEAIPGFLGATVNGALVRPELYPLLYHGNTSESRTEFEEHFGLPARGSDIELTSHVTPPPDQSYRSAFRGTVQYPLYPGVNSGAADWAGEGGFVFEIAKFPGYDVNRLLQGAVSNGFGGFRDNALFGEHEIAIPARVPATYVPRVGSVVSKRRGLAVNWENLCRP